MPGLTGTMHEWAAGKLHSGSTSGPVVRSQKQAVAIGLSEQRKAGMSRKRKAKRAKRRARGLVAKAFARR